MRLLYSCMGVLVAVLLDTPANASEIRIDGNRVVITTDDGETIDTANLPKGREVREGDGVVINEHGVSIGSVTSDGGEQKNVQRNTTLDNVVIVNNGKTTVYRKGAKADKGAGNAVGK